jgi:putative ABC transport system permease protein
MQLTRLTLRLISLLVPSAVRPRRREEWLGETGTGIGTIGALVTSKIVQSQMHGVQGLDPMSFSGSIVVLGAAMLMASAIPARRATRVDPITVLRQE